MYFLFFVVFCNSNGWKWENIIKEVQTELLAPLKWSELCGHGKLYGKLGRLILFCMHDSDTSVYSIRVVMRYVSTVLHTISFTKFGSDSGHALKFNYTSSTVLSYIGDWVKYVQLFVWWCLWLIRRQAVTKKF